MESILYLFVTEWPSGTGVEVAFNLEAATGGGAFVRLVASMLYVKEGYSLVQNNLSESNLMNGERSKLERDRMMMLMVSCKGK